MKQDSQSFILGNTFVTGGSGLLGSELVHQLINNQETKKIVCLIRDEVRNSRFFIEKMNEKVIVVRGDLRDGALIDRILNEYEIQTVFHLAAQTIVGHANNRPVETFDVNIRGTWELLEACRNNSKTVKAVLFASSDKAYGDLKGERYTEDFPLAGKHPYDVSKSCADLLAQAYAHTYGMNICVTRCGNFFGPGDLNENRIFPSTILSLLNNESPIIRSDGKFVRDYIFVNDGASAYRKLARFMYSKKLNGECFNFSYGLKLSVLELVDLIILRMSSKLKPVILNEAKNEIPVQALDSTKAIKLLNWEPDFGLEEGIDLTIQWYKNHFAKVSHVKN